jgi:hypothetical protein
MMTFASHANKTTPQRFPSPKENIRDIETGQLMMEPWSLVDKVDPTLGDNGTGVIHPVDA